MGVNSCLLIEIHYDSIAVYAHVANKLFMYLEKGKRTVAALFAFPLSSLYMINKGFVITVHC
ncbi:hypothetical protein [Peribacillus sp. FSL E2-0159]|uniref:hypothetical protein n=1 Tax=Peribacillus sp. FSL E2-0159 TaxID=2975289 RepID=UPI003159C982